MRREILKSFAEIPPPPCDSCALFEHCKMQREACGLFVEYARNRDREIPKVPDEHLNRIPSEKWYNDLFTDFVGHIPHRQGL